METTEKFNFLATLLPLAVIVFIIAVGVVLLTQQFHKNLYRQKLEQEALRNQHQVELLKSSIQVQENERKRIAQDIHDELGAVLSITKMHLIQLEDKEKNRANDLLPALQNIRTLTENAMQSMRRISHELMPQQLESFGLVKTLEAVAMQANKTGAVSVVIHASEDFPDLPWQSKLGLYRILMELLNNTLKHAGAKQVEVRLVHTDKHISCTYTDDGIGLPKDATVSDGLGSKSMEGRANALGGTMEVLSREKGFEAVICIPLVS